MYIFQRKGKFFRMQVQAFCGVASVESVPQNWKAAAGKVNANLVCAAGLESTFYKQARAAFYGDFAENAKICARILSAAAFRYFAPLTLLAFAGNSVHVEFDREGLRHVLFSFHHGEVLFCKVVTLEKLGNRAVYSSCFSKQNNSACCTVEAVHNSHIRRVT